ncbi:class I SAM-dependent methyltransferase [bacterium]|nr:class I SAM-dependent methyltransferase [bacterium]MBP9806706.1 class I SAM-dependent methyltransferase [bacterium]
MTKADELADSESEDQGAALPLEVVYQENICFWEKAWNMCKVPYTQLPDLSYIPRIAEELNKAGAKKVLDLGCGSGWLSVYLARQGFDVVGVDVSAQAINLANTWASQEDLKISFDVGDASQLQYQAGSFDAVVANSIFEHFPMKQAQLLTDKVNSMLKEGGVFVGCFDKVGGGPGEYYTLEDGTHVYTDKARKGMMLRRYSLDELQVLFNAFKTMANDEVDGGSIFLVANK